MHIGIDIGTHAARVAALDAAGRPYLIPDRYGAQQMPSVVRYSMHGVEVGEYPARYLSCNWENSVRGPTRYLARYADLPAAVLASAPFPLLDDHGQPLLDMLYTRVAPQEALGAIIAALRARAEHHLGQAVREAVLTVPASAEDRYRVLVRQAAETQGLRVCRLLNQPSAATIGYLGTMPTTASAPAGLLAVVDIGGGTSDVSIAELRGGRIHIRATAGDGFLGGHDLAGRVATGLAERLRSQAGRDLLAPGGSNVAALGLYHAAEQALERLALKPVVPVAIDHGGGFGRDLYTLLRREQAEAWIADELARIAELCRRVLIGAGLVASAITSVLLVGGGSGIPGVRATVARAFGRLPADVQRVEPLALAAYGAALVANQQGATLADVTPFPLGITCYYGSDELFSPIIGANTPIPTPPAGARGAYCQSYQTMLPDQTSVRLDLLQYRGPKTPTITCTVRPAECELLGSWLFDGLRPPRYGHAAFHLTFSVDADGILHLLAEEHGTGNRIEGVVRRI